MGQEEVRSFVARPFPDARIVVPSAESGSWEISWDDTFFFSDKEENTSAFPFATVVTKDYGEFDSASSLNRPGIFRLNIGLSRDKFRSLFGARFSPTDYDFTALDKLMPHPVYAPRFFVCILNPSDATSENTVRPLLVEAHAIAEKRGAHD